MKEENTKSLCSFEKDGKKYVALVRKLTERECFRLMGVDDTDIGKLLAAGIARTDLYKLAGNSIVVDVLYHIFRKAFIETGNDSQQMSFFDLDESNAPKWDHEHPLRVVTLCSGYDSQCLALERLKRDFPPFDYELIAWSEFDPMSKKPIDRQPAVIAHNALFPQWSDRNLGDMTKIDWTKAPEFDLLTYSTPCFVAGTKILTKDGYKNIEDINVGDYVLTHNNRYKRVVKIGSKPSYDIYKVRGMMCHTTLCTGNHPYYVRKMRRVGHKWVRTFDAPEWVQAEDLTKDYYLGFAVNKESAFPQWDGVTLNNWGHSKRVNALSEKFANPYFWYVMGRYVGDGWTRRDDTHKCVTICCSERNAERLEESLTKTGLNYTKVKDRNTYRMQINSKELCAFVERYGKGAINKCIDGETISLPDDMLSMFVNGIVDSDGCVTKGEYSITTASKALALGIMECVAKSRKTYCRLYYSKRKPTCIIEGREVRQHDTWLVKWHEGHRAQDKAFYEDGYCWYPIKSVEPMSESEIVYNIEVEEDHSYTANGAIVHNCQSISQAGLQHGFVEGSGTRSSIIWNVREALEIGKPKYALLENVAAMVSEKFLPMFNLWRNEVHNLGYENYAQLLNAKHYGVPQNRDRIFLFSIRNDIEMYYNFPQRMPLKCTLQDILEDETDEKYYLNPVKVNKFVNDNLAMVTKYMDESDEKIEPLPEHLRRMIDNAREAE